MAERKEPHIVVLGGKVPKNLGRIARNASVVLWNDIAQKRAS